jgi:hypothetical protein
VTNTRIPKVGEKGWTFEGGPVDILAVDAAEAWVRYTDSGGGAWSTYVSSLLPPQTEPIGYANIHPWPGGHLKAIGAMHRSRPEVDRWAVNEGRIAVLVWWTDGTVTVEATS